ncbi:MAG: DUF2088 domain-containing protein [Clostridia bacterium]|nr:DUF2088 domain-containing protein [Clostridia bacterium]
MRELAVYRDGKGLGGNEFREAALSSVQDELGSVRKVLLIPPDITRIHSRAGLLTEWYYDAFTGSGAEVDILPALGSHLKMSGEELRQMFGDRIPLDRFIAHNWRTDVETLGSIEQSVIEELSEGKLHYDISVQLNRRLLDPAYDLILCIGQVVPHEVAGLSSYSKHIFVGCGGSEMINRTHFLGAVYGTERILGVKDTPVRKVFDLAQKRYADPLPLYYCMTVIGRDAEAGAVNGLFIGKGTEAFDKASALAQELNIDYLDKPIHKAVVYLQKDEYRSTWVGNKAVYRTRMALADGARLLVLAPGVRTFGEDPENDKLIRKYGYYGREHTLQMVEENQDLADNLSSAAHLIHGSSDGRFAITYAVDESLMPKKDIESVGFAAADVAPLLEKYNPEHLQDGWNTMPDGEEIFFIRNPSLGLWMTR